MLGDPAGRRILYAGDHPDHTARALAAGGAAVTALVGPGTRLDYTDVLAMRAGLADVHFQPVYDVVVVEGSFSAAEEWEPSLLTAVQALRPDGLLVFTVVHPASGPDGAGRILRPLSAYLNTVIDAGCRIERIGEPESLLIVAARRNGKSRGR